jgi:hypothetical protein
MGDLTKRLSRHEFECACGCGQDTVDYELPFVLEDCADYFQNLFSQADRIKIKINSGNRCLSHNRKIGSKDDSQHVKSKAVDFYLIMVVSGEEKHINDDIVASYLEEKHKNKYGIGRYIGRTHIDARSAVARWDYR